jgi:hypothetical protein
MTVSLLLAIHNHRHGTHVTLFHLASKSDSGMDMLNLVACASSHRSHAANVHCLRYI